RPHRRGRPAPCRGCGRARRQEEARAGRGSVRRGDQGEPQGGRGRGEEGDQVMSEQGNGQGKRTPEEIEADLARTRQELASSVDELSTMLDPRVQLKEAKENISSAAKHAVDGASAKAQSILDEA